MMDNPHHPYDLDVVLCAKPAGHYAWAIRRSGKLLERSDRLYSSERSARKSGEEAIDRTLKGPLYR